MYAEIRQEGQDGKMGTTYGYDSVERIIKDCIELDNKNEVFSIKFY